MKFELKEISIRAKQEFEMINITQQVKDTVRECGISNGIVYVITEHTTTGITVNEALPCVEKDIMQTLDRLIPEIPPAI